MPYLLALVVVAIAVALGLLTIWGGIAFLIVAAIVLAVVFLGRAREVRVDRAVTGPTGRPRASRGSTSGGGTANERVGQG